LLGRPSGFNGFDVEAEPHPALRDELAGRAFIVRTLERQLIDTRSNTRTVAGSITSRG
jgi:hypothetical protein